MAQSRWKGPKGIKWVVILPLLFSCSGGRTEIEDDQPGLEGCNRLCARERECGIHRADCEASCRGSSWARNECGRALDALVACVHHHQPDCRWQFPELCDELLRQFKGCCGDC